LAVIASASVSSTIASHAATFTATDTIMAGPINASAIITPREGEVNVVIANNEANPTDVGQNVSDLTISLGNALTSTATYNGTQTNPIVRVGTNGTITTTGTTNQTWDLSTPSGSTILLSALTASAGPSDTLIGPPGPDGTYSNANGSIANNTAHNPFLSQTATFDILAPGVTPSTEITGTMFSFGTMGMPNVPGEEVTVPPIPLPPTIYLFGSVLGGAFWLGRRKRNAVSSLGAA